MTVKVNEMPSYDTQSEGKKDSKTKNVHIFPKVHITGKINSWNTRKHPKKLILAICYGRLRALKPNSAMGGSTKKVLPSFCLLPFMSLERCGAASCLLVHNNFTNHGRYFPNGLCWNIIFCCHAKYFLVVFYREIELSLHLQPPKQRSEWCVIPFSLQIYYSKRRLAM